MRKLFILSLLAMMIAWGIGGCGGGSGGTSADPLGTDSLTLESAASQVNSNGAVALKATVKNAAGTAVVGREVSFTIVSNASGATLTSSSANTDGAGEATILYRAGATAGSDVVRASISNGAKMDLNITVGGGTGSYQITLAADNTSLAAGQTAILTATVTNGSGDPVVGVVVTFAIPVNNTGAQTPTPVNGGLTDAGGKAVAYYTAGSNDSLMEVYDTIRGTLANGSSNVVIITRSAGTAPTDLSVTLATNPSTPSVPAGGTIIITATVAGDNKSGAAVTFSLPVNHSGASFINTSGTSVASITITAGGSGIATAIYQAGSTSPGTEVQDTIQAVLTNGANAAVILTRTSATTSYYAVTIVPSETSVTAGQVSIITATVTVSGTTPGPAGGVPVAFTLPVNSSGAALSAATATTDSSGKAVVIYQPGTTSPTLTVYDTVQAAVGTATDAKVIMRTGSSPSGFGIQVTPAPATLALDNSDSIITAKVTNTAGGVTNGLMVSFTVTGGGTVVPAWAITDGSGNAVTTFTGGPGARATGDTDVVIASITVGGNTYTSAALVSYP